MAETSQTEATIPNGEEIVERFGGIRPMAAKLEVPVTTVQGWKKRDAIPLNRRDDIITAASQYNINLKGLLSDFVANQNARASNGIEEDPALRSQSATSAPQSRSIHTQNDHIDIGAIHRSARTTSLVTSASLFIILGIAGFALFGGDLHHQSTQIASLQTRVSDMESHPPVAGGESSSIDATISALQGQVQAITNAIGATDLATNGQTLLQRLNALEQQLAGNPNAANLQGAVSQMQNMAGNPASWQQAIEELRGVVTGLQGRMDGLDSALQQAKTQNDALASTLSNVTGRDLSAAAMLLALTQLRDAVDRQTPFTSDLSLLHDVAQSADPELAASIDKLAPYAETGVLSSQGLKKQLQGLSNDIITAKLKGEDVSLKDRIMARLQGLFTLKKDGVPVTGGEERALIARASTQLDNNDVAGAAATLQQLQGPAADAAQPWQQQATATLNVQTLDHQLVSALMSKIKTMGNAASDVTSSSAPINMSAPSVPAQIVPETPAAPQPELQQQQAPDQSTTQSPVIIQQ